MDEKTFISTKEAPQLVVSGNVTGNPVFISKINISVEVDQNIVSTTMDMVFYNAHDRILGGELYFPLGEDEYVTDMEMEINGKLRKAVPVEKAKGREAYESVVRRQVDPALAELTKGNVFKTQVYPIPAKGYKRVLIRYQSRLAKVDDAFLVQVPLNFKESIAEFNLEVSVLQNKFKPEFQENGLSNFAFQEWHNIFKAEFHAKDYTPERSLSFVIPLNTKQQYIFTNTKNEAETYFHASVYNSNLSLHKKIIAPKVLVYWDASLSGKGRHVEKEIRLLEDYVRESAIRQVTVITFANDIISTHEFSGNSSAEIASYLQNIAYDGATDFSSLDFKAEGFDQVILCTDGIQSLGNSNKETATRLFMY